MKKGFLKAGHMPTLISAFLYFDLSFMAWVILGPLGVQIAKTLHLNPAEKGLMVAIPVLAGAASTACWSIISGQNARASSPN